MSFVLWVFTLFTHAWASSARLIDFVHAIDVSLALALAYSILLRLGNFSGASLNAWFEKEKGRVLAPLAEDARFDAYSYETTLTKCKERFHWFVRHANLVFMWWCVLASLGALIALILIPFHPDEIVSGKVALENAVMLAGPVPIGMLTLGATHVAARVMMHIHSSEGNTLIKHIAKVPVESLVAARQAIGQAPVQPSLFLGWEPKELLKGLITFAVAVFVLIYFFTH